VGTCLVQWKKNLAYKQKIPPYNEIALPEKQKNPPICGGA